MVRIVLMILASVHCFLLNAQGENDFRLEVLEANQIDSLFIEGKWSKEGGTELQLRYLGKLNFEGRSFKIMTSHWIWGMSCRATNRVLVYSDSNEFLGDFYLNMYNELPHFIKDNELYIGDYLDNNEGTNIVKVYFHDGMPRALILEGGAGMTYFFNEEEDPSLEKNSDK